MKGIAELLGQLGRSAKHAGDLALAGDQEGCEREIKRLTCLMGVAKGVQSGIRVFKDGRDITHRCKVSETDTCVTVDIGCDLDEAIMQISDPAEIHTYYMLGKNKISGHFDAIPLHLPRFIAEVMSKVLPGSFTNQSTQ